MKKPSEKDYTSWIIQMTTNTSHAHLFNARISDIHAKERTTPKASHSQGLKAEEGLRGPQAIHYAGDLPASRPAK